MSICIRIITDIYPRSRRPLEKSWFPLDDDKPSVVKMVVRKPTFTWWPRTSRVLHDICEYPIRILHVSNIPWFQADGSELELIHPGLTNVMGGRWLMLTLSLNIQTPAV